MKTLHSILVTAIVLALAPGNALAQEADDLGHPRLDHVLSDQSGHVLELDGQLNAPTPRTMPEQYAMAYLLSRDDLFPASDQTEYKVRATFEKDGARVVRLRQWIGPFESVDLAVDFAFDGDGTLRSIRGKVLHGGDVVLPPGYINAQEAAELAASAAFGGNAGEVLASLGKLRVEGEVRAAELRPQWRVEMVKGNSNNKAKKERKRAIVDAIDGTVTIIGEGKASAAESKAATTTTALSPLRSATRDQTESCEVTLPTYTGIGFCDPSGLTAETQAIGLNRLGYFESTSVDNICEWDADGLLVFKSGWTKTPVGNCSLDYPAPDPYGAQFKASTGAYPNNPDFLGSISRSYPITMDRVQIAFAELGDKAAQFKLSWDDTISTANTTFLIPYPISGCDDCLIDCTCSSTTEPCYENLIVTLYFDEDPNWISVAAEPNPQESEITLEMLTPVLTGTIRSFDLFPGPRIDPYLLPKLVFMPSYFEPTTNEYEAGALVQWQQDFKNTGCGLTTSSNLDPADPTRDFNADLFKIDQATSYELPSACSDYRFGGALGAGAVSDTRFVCDLQLPQATSEHYGPWSVDLENEKTGVASWKTIEIQGEAPRDLRIESASPVEARLAASTTTPKTRLSHLRIGQAFELELPVSSQPYESVDVRIDVRIAREGEPLVHLQSFDIGTVTSFQDVKLGPIVIPDDMGLIPADQDWGIIDLELELNPANGVSGELDYSAIYDSDPTNNLLTLPSWAVLSRLHLAAAVGKGGAKIIAYDEFDDSVPDDTPTSFYRYWKSGLGVLTFFDDYVEFQQQADTDPTSSPSRLRLISDSDDGARDPYDLGGAMIRFRREIDDGEVGLIGDRFRWISLSPWEAADNNWGTDPAAPKLAVSGTNQWRVGLWHSPLTTGIRSLFDPYPPTLDYPKANDGFAESTPLSNRMLDTRFLLDNACTGWQLAWPDPICTSWARHYLDYALILLDESASYDDYKLEMYYDDAGVWRPVPSVFDEGRSIKLAVKITPLGSTAMPELTEVSVLRTEADGGMHGMHATEIVDGTIDVFFLQDDASGETQPLAGDNWVADIEGETSFATNVKVVGGNTPVDVGDLEKLCVNRQPSFVPPAL